MSGDFAAVTESVAIQRGRRNYGMVSGVYQVPAEAVRVESEVKKSRFIACVARASDRQQALAFVESLRAEFPDARHHCWAYLFGDPDGSCEAATDDDGEPSGTAGKPILSVIQHKHIGDIVVVVVRYFGGIKLGAGGLTRAYAGAAEALLSTLSLEQREPLVRCTLRFDFSREQTLRHWAASRDIPVTKPEYGEQVTMTLQLTERLMPELLEECRANAIECTVQGEEGDGLSP